MKQTQRDYSLTFKLALVEQIEKGGLTSGALWHAGPATSEGGGA
ncbi:hypothetical protein [Aeromonas jandaei]